MGYRGAIGRAIRLAIGLAIGNREPLVCGCLGGELERHGLGRRCGACACARGRRTGRGGSAPIVRGHVKYARRFDARDKAERLTCVDR